MTDNRKKETVGNVLEYAAAYVQAHARDNTRAMLALVNKKKSDILGYPVEQLACALDELKQAIAESTDLSVRSRQNYAYALNALVRIADETLGTSSKRTSTFPDFLDEPKSGPETRRLSRYKRFKAWADQNDINLSELSTSHIEQYTEHVQLHNKPSTAGVLLSDLQRFWLEKVSDGLLPKLEWPSRRSDWFYGVPRKDWPVRVTEEFDLFLRSTKFGGKWGKVIRPGSIKFYERAVSL